MNGCLRRLGTLGARVGKASTTVGQSGMNSRWGVASKTMFTCCKWQASVNVSVAILMTVIALLASLSIVVGAKAERDSSRYIYP